MIALACTSCGPAPQSAQKRTVSSGRQIEVLSSTVVGPPERRHLWFDYRSDAQLREPLVQEIRDVWARPSQ